MRKYKALLSVAVLAGGLGLVVAEGQPVSASVPTAPALVNTTSPIKHVVVIYQENHSFDNVLGDVCQARLTRCDGFTGTVRLKTGAQVPMTVSPDVFPRVDHSVAS